MSASKKKPCVLILDDDPDLIEAIAGVLEDEGLEVHRRATRTVHDVVALKPDLLMVDCPPGAKAEVLKFVQQIRLRRDVAHIPILLGVTTARLLEPKLLRERNIDVLIRPFTLDDLIASVNHLLDASKLGRPSAP